MFNVFLTLLQMFWLLYCQFIILHACCIYIYAFGIWHFYLVYSRHKHHRTYDPGVASTMLYQLSYRNIKFDKDFI